MLDTLFFCQNFWLFCCFQVILAHFTHRFFVSKTLGTQSILKWRLNVKWRLFSCIINKLIAKTSNSWNIRKWMSYCHTFPMMKMGVSATNCLWCLVEFSFFSFKAFEYKAPFQQLSHQTPSCWVFNDKMPEKAWLMKAKYALSQIVISSSLDVLWSGNMARECILLFRNRFISVEVMTDFRPSMD